MQTEHNAKTMEEEIRYVQIENARLVDESNQQQYSVNEMARHMNVITEQNFKLSAELQRFLETDEVVKSKLSRKSAI